MKKMLIVEGDWNDADYVTNISWITDSQVVKLIPIFAKMKNQDKKAKEGDYVDDWRDKYPNLTEQELDLVEQYIPGGYEQSCHTVISATLYEISSKKELI